MAVALGFYPILDKSHVLSRATREVYAGDGLPLTRMGSVLFRTSAYTSAKHASRVPTGSKQDNSPHNDDVKDVSVLLESELIGPV